MSEQPHLPALEVIDDPHHPDNVSYELLKGHNRTDGTYKTDTELRHEYVRLTDPLITQMIEGVEVKDPVTGEVETRRPDAVVWLDKSARPVAWLARRLWPQLAADADGNVPDMPEFFFANIDREQWVNTIDPSGTGRVDVERVDPSIIRSLRSIYVEPKHKRDGLTQAIDNAPTLLDGKTVLIVDEVRASGRTLQIAKNFFTKAFPTAKIATTYWMGGAAVKGLATGNADLPVWYKDKVRTGRGVDNRNEISSRHSKSLTQRLGGWFLSTRLADQDPASVQLRDEMRKLAHDVGQGDVLVVPSSRSDNFEERASRLNGMTFDEFVVAKQALDAVIQQERRTQK